MTDQKPPVRKTSLHVKVDERLYRTFVVVCERLGVKITEATTEAVNDWHHRPSRPESVTWRRFDSARDSSMTLVRQELVSAFEFAQVSEQASAEARQTEHASVRGRLIEPAFVQEWERELASALACGPEQESASVPKGHAVCSQAGVSADWTGCAPSLCLWRTTRFPSSPGRPR